MMRATLYIIVLGAAGLGAAVLLVPEDSSVRTAQYWQEFTSPGPLASAHATLECNDCHTTVAGAVREKCVVCHANNQELLSRQPTSFHAHIGSCKECHTEHQGPNSLAMDMDHGLFARLAGQTLGEADAAPETQAVARALAMWSERSRAPHSAITPKEALLDCSACHANEDPHFGLFGRDCDQCHSTSAWTLPRFQHPSPRSKDCNQCHQAPPSHYMMHFKMVSAKVARKPHAKVEQCYVCHETTSWNDIVDVGWYKHH